ncbi:E-selectin-like isoform X2 [Dendropsophus ebraccatus]|uniref:E-selectin-like isoform X2 n=1 Tax=Dendropsophus ebraccatus TaxID=150705 RepID=UPI0038317A29
MTYLIFLFLLCCGFSSIYFTHAWTYHYSNHIMTYDDAKTYCRQKYTDMVAIQNQEENRHLSQILPFNPAYYWIGIRKDIKTGKWTWVGTNKELTKEAENWAEDEPNNKSETKNEDCVEMYVKRVKDAGKWNDERCSKKKVALCYTAACNTSSCNNHGECIETINSYTCNCSDGFFGKDCEHVVTCPEISGIDHGSVVCSHVHGNFAFQSNCNFACSDGYLLVGSENLQCNGNGDWGSQIPHCKVIQCERPELPDNGVMNCSHDGDLLPEKSTCNFSCKEGFAMVGSSSLLCTTPGQWSGSPPTCEAIQCDSPPAPKNGAIACFSDGETLPYNATCNFICDEGFILEGNPSIQCVTPSWWSAESPQCKAIQCERPEQPENGSMNCANSEEMLEYNSACTFTCDEGFAMVGSPSTQCSATGQWTENPPKCQAIQCSSLTAPVNGLMGCKDGSNYNSTCTFSCSEGYELIGSSELQCLSSGQWTSSAPLCKAVQCPSLTSPRNGRMVCQDSTNYKSQCSFSCSEGFRLIGSPVLTCQSSGTWTSSAPRCEAIQCPSLTAPEDGHVSCHDTTNYKSQCSFGCSKGFRLIGSPILSCQSSGEWSSSVPTCEAVRCDALVTPPMGKMNCSHMDIGYGTVCKFTCEYDLRLNGTDTLECDSNGKWNTEAPTCEAVKVSPETATYATVGIVTSGASVMSAASLIIWLVKRMRKTAKKFTPSNCQNLEGAGVYQNNDGSLEVV